MMAAAEFDAHLDPWCLVPLEDDSEILFGYAHKHPETGGLAWLTSTEVVHLSPSGRRATTRSGRRYRLGRRFNAVDVGAEGEEARLAFELLVGRDDADADELVEVDRRWLMARKAARHLGLEPPARTDAATRGFFENHGDTYVAVRRHGITS